MVSAGADYLLNDKALVGLSMHYDRMSDPTVADAMINGNGWLLGPYTSFELGTGVFWDSSLLYGGSSNDIDTPFWDGDFDTRRWLIDTAISGVWDLDAVTRLTPKLRAVYLSEKVMDYAVENASQDAIDIDIEGFTDEQLRVSIGAEIARAFALESGFVLTPTLGLTAGFSGLDGSGAFGSVSAGLTLQSQESWSVNSGLLLNMDAEGETSLGGKIGVSGQF